MSLSDLSIHGKLKALTSAERQEVKSPVLLATSSLAAFLDVLQRRLLTPIELEADLAGESQKTGWVLDQLVFYNFPLEFLLLEANPGEVLKRLLDVHNTDIPWYGDDEDPVFVSAEMSIPTVIIVLEVALTDWAPLKAFLRVDVSWDMGLEVCAKGGGS